MADTMIYGEGVSYSTDTSVTGMNNNGLIVGSSGCGKTTSVAEPCIIEANEDSIIVPVSKRRLIDVYAPVLKKRGYRVGVIDFANPKKSVLSFDPMRSVRTQQDIQSLADFVVNSSANKDEGNHGDPYWDNAAISLLSALIFYTRETIPNATFYDVYQVFSNLEILGGEEEVQTSLDAPFKKLERNCDNRYAITWWKTFQHLPVRTANCVYSSLATPMNYLFTPDLLEMIESKPSVCFEEIAQRKTALFIYTSAVRPVLNHFVKLFYSYAIQDLFEYAESLPGGKLPIQVHLLCDDFANGGRIQNFAEYISIFREKGISVTLLIQSESQLQGMYGEADAVTIINNCDTYVYMGGTDIQTCESVSRRANVPFEDIFCMPKEQIYVFRRGQKPIRTCRYRTLEDPRYQKAMNDYAKAQHVKGNPGPENG